MIRSEECEDDQDGAKWKREKTKARTEQGRRRDGTCDDTRQGTEKKKKNVEDVGNAGGYESKDVGTNGDEYRCNGYGKRMAEVKATM